MRKILVIILFIGMLAYAWFNYQQSSSIKKTDANQKESPAQSLKIGDPAPPLKATTWLQGNEVKEFTPGKIYVVEFWATWCGPCITMMPHLGEIQEKFRDNGVTVIGYTNTADDQNNTPEKVAAFVAKRGPKLGYTFAYGDKRDTYDAWMIASGQTGIPCSFVVDQAGKIVYIGHPMFLGEVLPKVIEGTWKVSEAESQIAKMDKDLSEVFQVISKQDAKAGLEALAEFQVKYPDSIDSPFFVVPRLEMLLNAEKFDEFKKTVDETIAKATKQDDTMTLHTLLQVLSNPAVQKDKDLADQTVKAAEAYLKAVGDKDPLALVGVSQAYFAVGDKVKAREFARKALDVSGSKESDLKKYIEKLLKKVRRGEERRR